MLRYLLTDQSCVAPVFQMFRFEVHLRITDESVQHIQHMDPPNSFLFSSLFDGDGSMTVGGSHSDSAEALLSSLRGEELCRGLVDDLVSRTSGKESGWKVDFHGDWSLFSSSGDTSPQWSSEDDQNQTDLDCEESRALWESLSSCSDPYNPLFFSASFSTSSRVEKEPTKVLVTRSDSEISWSGSDSSGLNEESEKLLELFNIADPYNPMCFTASVSSTVEQQLRIRETTGSEILRPCADEEEDEDEEEFEQQQEEEEEEELPWNPLYLHNAAPANTPLKNCVDNQGRNLCDRKPRPSKPKSQHHSHSKQTRVPWKKPDLEESKGSDSGSNQKQVSTHQFHHWCCQAVTQCHSDLFQEVTVTTVRFFRELVCM